MLTTEQIDTYERVGALVVAQVLEPHEVTHLQRVTEEFVALAREVSRSNDVFDLEPDHTSRVPRVRRIKSPELHHEAFQAIVRHSGIIAILSALWGPNVRFDGGKLNMKTRGGGAAVEWHQDWAFYPHTNDSLAAVGIMLDDMTLDNGPLMIIPGSHRGPVFDHHCNGRFCGAIDPGNSKVDYGNATPLIGRAGDITVHHVRLVHGSAANISSTQRRLLLFQYRAADAWPLLGISSGWEKYESLLVSGCSSVEPRMEHLPVRLPLPPAEREGSIYEIQRGLDRRFFPPVGGASA